MKTITLPQTGKIPLSFQGELLAQASTEGNTHQIRTWHFRLYQASNGFYVLNEYLATEWDYEPDYYRNTLAMPDDLTHAIGSLPALPDGYGFPSGDARQAKLVGYIERQRQSVLVELLTEAGLVETFA
jgi:hypothetical protein